MSSSSEIDNLSDTPYTTPCATPPQNYQRRNTSTITASLEFGGFDFSFRIPSELYVRTSQLIDYYLRTLTNAPSAPNTLLSLVTKFLQFITDGGRNGKQQELDSEILKCVLVVFERKFLGNNDIHCFAASERGVLGDEDIIGIYLRACALTNRDFVSRTPALLRAAFERSASIYTIFGGQGNTSTYFEDLRQIHCTYSSLVAEFLTSSAELLLSLSRDKRCRKTFSNEFDVLKWLRFPGTTPASDVLVSAPMSFPLLGLLQLLNYMVACKTIGETPCTFQKYLSGTTGHSQGIIAAVVTASANSWDSFNSIAHSAITILFWIGVRSQQTYPQTVLPPAIVKDSVDSGEGVPTPMLSIRDMPQSQLQRFIDNTNSYFPADQHVSIGLINNSQNFVVAGPPMTLHGLNVKLRQIKPAAGDSQAKIPFSTRKLVFSGSFLPITAPFHSKYLAPASAIILEDVEEIEILGTSLRIPVFHLTSGEDLSKSRVNIVPELVRMITEEVVNWPVATKFDDATHILDFGAGGASGIGMLTNRNKDGQGLRVILADKLQGLSTTVGYQSELFSRYDDDIRYGCDWTKTFSPRLIQIPGGTLIDTKLSRVLGLPPFVIGGMIPTTVAWDFVAAAMTAGYHIELAAGGYHRAEDLEFALLKLEKAIPIGRGITVNVIYANPQAIAWQIPLLAKLRAQGLPIDGITVGAGVPSPEVAENYIKTIGLKHISFKPGSTDAIEAVIRIAKANPAFPVILQWTGGRAGGHHSFEDFHNPILATYGIIRQCPNLILVAGSGFGGSEDTVPYMTGDWSTEFGHPKMPFDGCLFGSRLMVAKEAHTSRATKLAIINTPGVSDADWEKTYKGPDGAGGVVTVVSEMGEPIHMLATRGARFWSEMDQMIFKLPPALRVESLKRSQKYIVEKLNKDFQRVWFGRDTDGRPVEIDDMTYGEVLSRLIDLLYIQRGGEWQWIDASYKKFTLDFARRIEQRFNKSSTSILESINDPLSLVKRILNAYHLAGEQLMNSQDVQFFLSLSRQRGQKPLPFVPVLDDHFQTYFKKDSLWQSEDLEAVVGQDVERTCILHGPVAARWSTTLDESVKEIMDRINQGHISNLVTKIYGGSLGSVPSACLSWTRRGNKIGTLNALDNIHKWAVSETKEKHIYRVPSEERPLADSWFHLLAGSERNWREVLFLSDVVMSGHRYLRNPIKDVFAPLSGHVVEIINPNDPFSGCVILKKRCKARGEFVTIASVEFWSKHGKARLCLWSRSSPTRRGIALPLRFTFHPSMGNTPVHENLNGRKERIRRFYWQTWFGSDESYDSSVDIAQIFHGDEIKVNAESVRNFVQSIGYKGEASMGRSGKDITAPIDYAIVVAWKAVTQPLFCESLDGNLLDLVHLSNEFKMVPGASPLKVGDSVLTVSRVTAVVNQDSGRMVEVSGTVLRNNTPVVEVISRFLFRGIYSDYEGTFQMKQEMSKEIHLPGPKEIAVLASKSWLQLDLEDMETELLGKTLEFHLATTNYFNGKDTFELIRTTGDVMMQRSSQSPIKVGSVNFRAGVSSSNSVIEYLERRGSSIMSVIPLKNPIPITSQNDEHHILIAPASNEVYAEASGDTNPIHISHIFAQYVNLPGTITHGMWTSAAVRSLLEATDNHGSRVHSWKVSFVGMVLPNDVLHCTFEHTAMVAGRKLITTSVRNAATNALVLTGEAEITQPTTAYVFTGQGSQRKGMGMALRESSPIARAVWDRADTYFMNTFGFTLTNIVQNDPKELTIHFGGPKGKKIRQNFMDLTQESPSTSLPVRLLPEITARSTSYTFRSPMGLLSATQFTQPALTLMEIALFSDMDSKGLVAENASFAGHSLGEYSALAAMGGGLLPIEVPVALTFYRGLAMQVNVERDAQGRSEYSMCAVNPSKAIGLNENGLKSLVERIMEQTGWLIEIVNFNVRDAQYICAGEIRALALLTDLLNHLISIRRSFTSFSDIELAELIGKLGFTSKTDYERGPATVPLKQIDVPFHSSFLEKNIASYRTFLKGMIKREKVETGKLVGRWVPNITGKPFGLEKSDFQELERVTGSHRVGEILAGWEGFEKRREE